jgi:hypothetical protein
METDTVFSSMVKYNGIFSFHEFYKFCYDWLKDETGFPKLVEDKYEEKLKGEGKDIVVEWTCEKKITDYFRFDVNLKFNITNLTNVEINQGGAKVSTNKGGVKMTMKGILVRD